MSRRVADVGSSRPSPLTTRFPPAVTALGGGHFGGRGRRGGRAAAAAAAAAVEAIHVNKTGALIKRHAALMCRAASATYGEPQCNRAAAAGGRVAGGWEDGGRVARSMARCRWFSRPPAAAADSAVNPSNGPPYMTTCIGRLLLLVIFALTGFSCSSGKKNC